MSFREPPFLRLTTVRPLVVPELLTLPAEIDITNAADVREMLRAAFRPRVAVVIADLTGTVFCDSAGARELYVATECAEENLAQLRLVIRNGTVLRSLNILGFDRLLRIYPTLGAALSDPVIPA